MAGGDRVRDSVADMRPRGVAVFDRLPLDSPLWGELSSCYEHFSVPVLLRQIIESRDLGEPWERLTDEMTHQGTVYQVASAAIPHLVDVAPELPAPSRRQLWCWVGYMVSAGAGRFPSPPTAGLQETLTASLGVAETLSLGDFAQLAEGLSGPGSASPADTSELALACVALAGHPVGEAMSTHTELSPREGYVGVVCPRCDAEAEIDGFGDPFAPPAPRRRSGPHGAGPPSRGARSRRRYVG